MQLTGIARYLYAATVTVFRTNIDDARYRRVDIGCTLVGDIAEVNFAAMNVLWSLKSTFQR